MLKVKYVAGYFQVIKITDSVLLLFYFLVSLNVHSNTLEI